MVNIIKTRYLNLVGILTNINLVTVSTPLLMVMVFQFFRFFLLPFMGLMPQEAYYHMYGQFLDWSYYDHPGMIGYLIRFFTEILGNTAFTIKLMDFVLTSISLSLFYSLSRMFLERRHAHIAVLLFGTSFMVSVLSFNATPDVPLILFWCGALLGLARAIIEQRKKYWLVTGICMALAIQSKYTAVFLPMGMMAFLCIDADARKFLKTPYPYLVLLLFTLGASPIVYWNYINDFASFGFQTGDRIHKIAQMQFRLEWVLGFFLVQALIVLPVTFYYLFKGITRFWKDVIVKQKLPKQRDLFLISFLLPMFMAFLFISPIYWIKLNWLFPCYVTGIIWIAKHIPRAHVMGQVLFASVLHLLIAVEFIFYPVPIKSDDTWFGWEDLSRQVQVLTMEYPKDFVFSADNYKTSSELNFYLDEKVFGANILNGNGLQYNILDDNLETLAGRSALYIDSEKRFSDLKKRGTVPEKLNIHFNGVEELSPVIIHNQYGTAVRKFIVYRCHGYCPPIQE